VRPEGRACLHCIWMVWPGARSPSVRFMTEMSVTCQVTQAIELPGEGESDEAPISPGLPHGPAPGGRSHPQDPFRTGTALNTDDTPGIRQAQDIRVPTQ
jgi:hypothetical protein